MTFPYPENNAATIVAKILAALTMVNGIYMTLTPEKAGMKLYHLSKEDITSTIAQLIRNNGMSALSLATTQYLLAYANVMPSTAIASGLIPRLTVLLYNYATKTPLRYRRPLALIPIYITRIFCVARIVIGVYDWIESSVAMQILSFFYISAGLGMIIAPKQMSNQLLRLDDATKTEQRCLRAQGKTDVINGVLIWALSTSEGFLRSMGLSCLAWIAAILYSDFIVCAGTTKRYAIIQLFIACLVVVIQL